MELNVLTENRVRPFSCGTEGADWIASHCDRCTKRIPDDADYTGYKCDIQRALGDAYMTDGTVSADIGRRLGYSPTTGQIAWPCPEVEWSAEWLAECKRRATWSYRVRKWWFTRRRNWRRWYDGKRDKWIEWWRWPEAMRHNAPETEGCWADWALWATNYREDRPSPGSCKRCREDAKETGFCWCGKFNDQEPEVRT